jgi:PilZ domain-containing protein
VAMEVQDQSQSRQTPVRVEQRGCPRFKLDVDVELHTRGGESLRGRTVDISESGISALLKVEIALDAVVEVEFSLPHFPLAGEKVNVLAVVRQRNAFRYGFQFADPDPTRGVIRRACEWLVPCP